MPSISAARLVLGLVLIAATQVLALQANLASVVDWHKTLIGVPLLEPSPPSFVDTPAGKRIVAITQSNVIACLNAASGGIAWRHLLEHDDPVVSYHAYSDSILLLSGPSATTARLFNLTTGTAIWEKSLLAGITAHLTNPSHLGTDASFTSEPSPAVVVLSGGRRVSKLRLSDGYEEWAMEAPSQGDDILFKQLLISDQAVHILAVTKSFESLTLTTLTLDLMTSRPLDDFAQIPCLLAAPENAWLMGSDIPGSARVVWLEVGRIKTTYIGPGGYVGNTKDLLPKRGRYYHSIVAAGSRKSGLILGMAEGGEVTVLDVREGGRPMTIWEGTAHTEGKSPSVYSSAPTETGAVFSRIYWSFANSWSVIEALSVSFEGDVIQSGYTYAFDTAEHGVILDAAVSPMLPFEQISARNEFMPTLMLTTSSGAMQLVHGQGIAWQREESLADIAATRFVDLGEPEVESTEEVLAEESYIGRTSRHIIQLKNLPGYIIRFAQRLITSSYSSAQQTSPLKLGKLHRDQFGLQKLLVAATKNGKLFAIDSANGNIVWRRNLGVTTEKGAELSVQGMWNVRGVEEGDGAMLAVLATRTAGNVTTTVGFHIEALTGTVKGDHHSETSLPVGKEIFAGQSETAFLVPFENCGTKIKVLAVVDETKKIHIFPKCKKVAANLFAMAPELFFTTSSDNLGGPVLSGHSPSSAIDSFVLGSTPLWSRQPTPGERLTSTSPVIFDNIASYGRPLGGKGVLYKYLNPHLLVLASSNGEKQYGKVEVLDSTSGRVIYAAIVDNLRGEVKTAMVENWLVFAWRTDEGWRITSVELYEDVKGKGQAPGTSTFGLGHGIKTEERTFFLGFGVVALSFTTSKFGITAKELLIVNDRNQIASIPRRLLDPRRPKGKPTSADKEEMLLPYDSVIQYESKRVVSHKYQVLGAEHLTTSPTLAESTSLLFAYGLDLFATRGLTPSGTFDILSDSFNKVQILLSLAVLSGGIAVARPAVRRKNLKMRWY